MALWLALVLPALPLQLVARALAGNGLDDTAQPLAVTDGPPQRPQIAFCNAAARATGISAGQKLAAAQALAQTLLALPRQPPREAAALHELACWAYQFSAAVVPCAADREHALRLEIGGSLRLFGGRAALLARLRDGLAALGYRAHAGIAPTPQGAHWLARGHALDAAPDRPGRIRAAWSPEHLAATLDPLPLAVLDPQHTPVATLEELGLRRLAELDRLPRAALRRRVGGALPLELDRGYGRVPDPQPPFAPPPRFDAGLDLPADLDDSAQLLPAAQRLLHALEGFLRGHGAGAAELAFDVHHARQRGVPLPPTRIALALAAPERDARRLAALLAERLARVALPAPATRLQLSVARLQPYAARNASLLAAAPAQAAQDWDELADTLHARLGRDRVFRLQPVDDHRPEQAQRALPLVPAPPPEVALRGLPPVSPLPPRPLLLLATPQPLPERAADGRPADASVAYGGPLTLLAGPERIEAGWWAQDEAPLRRDYFVARNPRGQVLWIFRELAAPRGWFLHGFFA